MGLPKRVLRTIGLAAADDTQNLERLATLRGTIGRQLGGRNTNIVGTDRGDPTRSLTGPVPARVDVSRSIASISSGTRAGYRPQQTVQDTALANPDLDPYNVLLLRRMNAGS